MKDQYDALKLSNQLCFPLYAAAKGLIKKYKPFLEPYNLTYTQYITMMVLWEEKSIGVKALGEKLYLDSGTLTPLLKRLEKEGYIQRIRDTIDERNMNISLTKEGIELKEKMINIPSEIGKCINLSAEEAVFLYDVLYKILRL